jgi:hypothetical protein
MATEEKEAFLKRWSRLKKEKPDAVQKQDESPPPQLPAVEKLTPESDFSGFMHPKVEDALRRVALKKLFSDPHFNVPDPYEAYSGDWTVGEPISQEMLATLNQARTHLFTETEDDKDKKQEVAQRPAGEEPQQDEPGRQDT